MNDKLAALYAAIGWKAIVGLVCAVIVLFAPAYVDTIVYALENALGITIYKIEPEAPVALPTKTLGI